MCGCLNASCFYLLTQLSAEYQTAIAMRPAEKRMKKVDLKLLKYVFINYSEKDKVD
jgi:hypothetical protein